VFCINKVTLTVLSLVLFHTSTIEYWPEDRVDKRKGVNIHCFPN